MPPATPAPRNLRRDHFRDPGSGQSLGDMPSELRGDDDEFIEFDFENREPLVAIYYGVIPAQAGTQFFASVAGFPPARE